MGSTSSVQMITLLVFLVVVAGLYWLIRLAVRHGICDARRDSDTHAPGTNDASPGTNRG